MRLTHKSIVDKDEYKTLLEEVKESRLAYDMEEVTEGLVCVAAPVLSTEWNSNLCNQCQRVQRADGQKPYSVIPRLQDTASECENLFR